MLLEKQRKPPIRETKRNEDEEEVAALVVVVRVMALLVVVITEVVKKVKVKVVVKVRRKKRRVIIYSFTGVKEDHLVPKRKARDFWKTETTTNDKSERFVYLYLPTGIPYYWTTHARNQFQHAQTEIQYKGTMKRDGQKVLQGGRRKMGEGRLFEITEVPFFFFFVLFFYNGTLFDFLCLFKTLLISKQF